MIKDIFLKLDYKFVQSLEWRAFETLCFYTFRFLGYRPKLNNGGKNAGIVIELFNDSDKKIAIIQCKALKTQIGVSLIREFVGVKFENKINNAIFISLNGFTDDAIETARTNKITLITTEILISIIYNKLSYAHQKDIYQSLAGGNEESTPTCAHCGIKMVERISKKGRNKGRKFWGCPNYSESGSNKCKNILYISNKK